MNYLGFGDVVKDAFRIVKKDSHLILKKPAGYYVVKEFSERIYKIKLNRKGLSFERSF